MDYNAFCVKYKVTWYITDIQDLNVVVEDNSQTLATTCVEQCYKPQCQIVIDIQKALI